MRLTNSEDCEKVSVTMKDMSIVSKGRTLNMMLESLGVRIQGVIMVDMQENLHLGYHLQTRPIGSGGKEDEIRLHRILARKTIEENADDTEIQGTRLTTEKRDEIRLHRILMRKAIEENVDDTGMKGIKLTTEKGDVIAVAAAVVARIVILDHVTGATLRRRWISIKRSSKRGVTRLRP